MNWNAIIKGVCVAVVLMCVGLTPHNIKWWLAMVAMNVMIVI